MNTDQITTILGVILGALQAANIDFSKLLSGNKDETGKAIAAVVTVALGYFTNKHPSPPPGAPVAPRVSALLPFILAAGLAGGVGCATLDPKADPVEVRAEQAVSVAYDTFDAFLKIELANEAQLRDKAPDVVKFAAWLTTVQPDGQPRGVSIIQSANAARRAYKANRSPDNKATLTAALAALETALAETNKQLSNIK